MTSLRSALAGVALLLGLSTAGLAQSNYPSPGGSTVPLYLQGCLNGSNQAVPCGAGSTTNVGGSGATNADGVAVASTGAVPSESFNFLFNGATWDRQRGDLTGGAWVQGAVAAGAADSGNPVKIGGRFNTSAPTLANGQRGDVQITPGGSLIVAVGVQGGAQAGVGNYGSGDGNNAGTGTLSTASLSQLYNGTTFDRQRSINSAQAAGTGTAAVAIAPTSAASGGISPAVSASAENNHVLKASAGNAYNASATNLTATAGFLVLLNATTAPADGPITPLACAPLPANQAASINYGNIPGVFSTGITAVVTSAATCFTKTTGVITAFISGQVQ